MKTEGYRNWYQSIHYDTLSCRQVSFSEPQRTNSREEHQQKLYVSELKAQRRRADAAVVKS